jgi:hypothetical protein
MAWTYRIFAVDRFVFVTCGDGNSGIRISLDEINADGGR